MKRQDRDQPEDILQPIDRLSWRSTCRSGNSNRYDQSAVSRDPRECFKRRRRRTRMLSSMLLLLCFFVPSCVCEYVREFEVSEGVPVGTSLGFIGDPNPGSPKPPPPPYLIVPVPGSAVDSDLNIEQSTGEIRTRVVLDREVRSSYSLVAIPLAGENIRILISVKDENDNAPTFPQSYLHIEFPENTPRDVKRTLPPARDLDLGIDNTQRYSIASGNTNNAFRLSSHRERDGVLYLDLQINGFLDRELSSFYSLVIEALDGGNPPMKGQMTVNITIQDVNDNQPIFNQSRYFATVPENATVGTSVMQVFATDTDSGDNGRITYSINRRQSDRDSMFTINTQTGVISVNRPLDFETKEVHELVVVASDNGLQALETTAFVSIRVSDVNDNQPTINLIFLSDDATPKISEDAQPGEFVARISVNDPDSKEEYANVNVTLEGGEGHFGLTTRDNIIYLMIVSLPLDREMRPNYTLLVTATDQGSPPLHASREFQMVVTDTNDNPPEFDRTIYYANVLEVADPGTSVFQLSALDRDEGNNSVITYSIVDTPDTHSDWFQIDPKTGLITTRKHIDCETDPVPQLTIVASDNGEPSLTGSTTVRVTIRDVNDNEPIFDQSFYNVSIAEDVAVGQCILKVSATDPDCGVNALVNYTVGEGFLRNGEFEVRPTTGEVCISSVLDHEKRSLYEFPIIATDRGGLSTTAMVKIQISDVNDNRPVFYPREYNVSLREREVFSTPIVVVVATDKDSGKFGTVRYVITAGNENNLFRVEPSTGEIYMQRPLSKSKPMHRLNISASDGGGLKSALDSEVLVSVIDSSHQPPTFEKARYTFSVREDVERNSMVGTVTASSVTDDNIRYSIYSGDPESYFTISAETGVIRTNAPLDHEAHPYVLLNVAATSGEPPSFGHTQVNITIGDINDNAPEFDTPVVKLSVPENTELGLPIYAAHADDLDSGDNGIVRYELHNNPDQTFLIDSKQGYLSLAKSLDFETTQKYSLVIVAIDGGNPALRSNVTLNIEAQDVNDNVPVFEKKEYQVNILETLPVNTQVLQVKATDMDTGNNARITYRIKEEEIEHIFGIFPNSGSLYLKEVLDRETRDRYSFTVVAMDNGSPPGSASTSVNVNVLDANDNDPVFSKGIYEFKVEENSEKGVLIGQIMATDRDTDTNAALRYSLDQTNGTFQINPTTGEIFVRQPLDRESKSTYELSADVRDMGTPPRSSRTKIRVIVTDRNDNAPSIIEPEEGIVTIREEMPPGTEVTRVRAVDADEGENATIIYRIVKHEGDASNIFTIDETSGIVRARVTLDHEDRPLYRLTVAAQDQGRSPKETQKVLQIEVLDLNDNRPTFSTSTVLFKVSEDVGIGTEIGTVYAEDRDVGENGRISYVLVSGNVYGCFDINKNTGTLYTIHELDRELASQFNLQIKAIDSSATNPQSNVINVKIEIEDVNDNAPVFKEDPIIFSVSESLTVGSPVWNFSVSDPDEGQNSAVQFAITQQWPFSAFKINSNSGLLSTIAPLDYEQHPDFTLVITATDQAEKEEDRLSTSVTVRIFVEDYNDNPPVFVSRTRVDIMEDEPVGFPILHVIAIDRDSRDNGRVSYNLVSGNEGNFFAIDSNTGMLSLTRPLDRQAQQLYKLNVTAMDHGKPAKISYNVITVKIEGVSDNPPRFSQPVYQATVPENSATNTMVVKVTAAEKEAEVPTNLTYSLPNGIADGKFNIDSVSGVITTTGSLDRETAASYVLTVYVHDSSVPVQYDTATVTIEVLDLNDHTPDFGDSCYPLSIPENNEFSVIHTAVATDNDSGINGEVTYSIIGGNIGNKFSIDLHTGQLSSRPLDRETRDRYQLVIAAQDRGTPPRQGLCNITVIVEDENDNDPKFTQNRYTATVSEDAAAGTPVLTVQALDSDRGPNAKVTYALSNETHWLFRIDNVTGVITTAGTFDREQKSSYIFEVRATDGGRYDARSERAQVHITIGDVNDNKPVFTQYPFTVDIPAFVQPDQQLVKISAEDKDEGPNGEVVYSFLGDASQRFRINPTTGIITTLSSFTMEAGRNLHLEVLARDRGSPSMSSTGLVEIRVGDGEPLPGTPTLRFHNSTYTIRLQENAPVGKDVVQVLAVRSDGRRQRINYSFGSGNEDLTFEINSNNGLIRVRDPKNLDFEMNQRFKLIVVAQAEGLTPLYGYATVWVELTDQNDNAPRFTQDHYMASVWEGNNKGTFVMQVSAADSDSNANANVAYHIVDGNHDNAFIIEPPFSGIIKTNIVLDREIRDSYRLTIIATDDGSPQLTGTCSLRINIVDVNDNQPTFPPYSVVSVGEGSVVGTVITTITANDVDTNPTLVYDFADGGNPDKRFAIDRFSGRITLAAPLDHEKQTKYTLRVQASDSAHITETSLMVTVVDENDNAPIFSQYSYEVLVPELTEAGRPILTVNASDRDSGINAKIRYSIVSGVWEGFYIGEETGVIYANRTIPYDPRRSAMYLIVKAEDSGKPPKSSLAPVRIVIADVNNHAPKFSQDSYSVTVAEDSPRGTTVIQVTASDKDETRDNRNIDYFIEAGNTNETFQITSDSGEIILVRPVDREEVSTFHLKVLAMDRGSPSRNATTDVTVTVEDTNDNPPLFNQSSFEVNISEGQTVGSAVIHLSADDKDEGDNGRIRYDITSGNERNMFEVDSMTGIVTVKKQLDYDKTPEYKLVVRASDGHRDHPLSAITALLVKLQDENDNAPVFPVRQYLEYVAENMPVGSSVFTAKANDQDKGAYGQLNYTITESDAASFSIDKLSGVVTTNSVFDYETQNKYYFVVTATDLGGLATSAQVQIEVESRDEFAPEFDERSYSFVVRGDAEVGHIVGRVHATDRDKGHDGRVVYHLRNNHPNFKINKTNGIIIIRKRLDDSSSGRKKREVQQNPSVSLVVVASSGRFGSLTNMTVVEVTIDGDGVLTSAEAGANVGMADWALGLLISLVFLVIGFIATLVFLHFRHRRQSKKSDNPHGKQPIASMSDHHYDQSTFDTLSYPPQYDNMPGYDPTDRRHRHTNTTSEISDQSHSASSGRGSAEDGENDVDEEIRMINEGPLRQQQQAAKLQRLGLTVLVPDPGTHGDDDNLSDVSVQNTQEYLARLGIDTSRSDLPESALNLPPHLTHPHSHSLASMHIYDESGGAETESMDFSNLIYAKLNDDSNGSVIEGQRPYGYVVDDSQPSMTGSLSSIVHSEEELTGSYNWDYLLDWGPQYQPLAHVFGEIARLKDDNLPDNYSSSSSVSKKTVTPVKAIPPPLITNVAPRTIAPVVTNRIGYPNMHMLPRSPISHESSFAGPALSPSFSPSLSPLATRSPSISPMVASGLVRSSRSAVNAPSSSSEAEMRL